MNTNVRIYLAWVSAHISINGNENADTWAKRSLQYNIFGLDIFTSSPINNKTYMFNTSIE